MLTLEVEDDEDGKVKAKKLRLPLKWNMKKMEI